MTINLLRFYTVNQDWFAEVNDIAFFMDSIQQPHAPSHSTFEQDLHEGGRRKAKWSSIQ